MKTNNDVQSKDKAVELAIGNLLRAGVLLAVAVGLVGEAVMLAHRGLAHPNYTVFLGEPPNLRTFRGILASVFSLQGRGIIQLGLLILIATPVARVAFSVIAFAVEHDRLYVFITLIVLGVLIFSLAGGHF
jgi:uncharacterized membrane protein